MSLSCETVDFILERSLKRGVSYRIPLTIRDKGIPIKLQNLTAKCCIKQYYDESCSIYEPIVEFVNPLQGLIHLVFDGNLTKNIQPKRYIYDVFFTNLAGRKYSFIEGRIEFSV